MDWNYAPSSKFQVPSGAKIGDWIAALLVWLLNWLNQNFGLLAILGGGLLVTKVFKIRLNVGGK